VGSELVDQIGNGVNDSGGAEGWRSASSAVARSPGREPTGSASLASHLPGGLVLAQAEEPGMTQPPG
jgi:hypothetical protein